MQIEIKELTETKAEFIISNTDISIVNALRRILLAEIPKMAIDEVEFHLGSITDETIQKDYESVSPLFDEIIAHRLSMLPIPTDLELFKFKSECVCKNEGCPNCTIIYSINKKGPCTIYSGDLEPLGDIKFKIKDENIPIVKLADKQALLVYAHAILGTAKQHAKWQVTSGVGYKYYPEIQINYEKCDAEGSCIKKCPKKIFKFDKKRKIILENVEDCIFCGICEEVCNPNKAIKVKKNEDKIIFKFETDGSLSAKEAFKQAIKILQKKFIDFEESMLKIR